MKLRRVSADVLLPKPTARTVSPRERKRLELEAALEPVIREAALDPGVAFRVTLADDDTLTAVRAAFGRARERVGADAVNLVTVDGDLFVAATPKHQGRKTQGA